MKKKNILKRKGGFTLIELIVVIAILGILAAIVAPRLMGFQESARESSDEQMAATIANAAAIHITELDTFAGITDTDAFLGELSGKGLIDAGIDSSTEIVAALKSQKYTGFSISYDTTNHVLTVTLTAADAADNFTVTK